MGGVRRSHALALGGVAALLLLLLARLPPPSAPAPRPPPAAAREASVPAPGAGPDRTEPARANTTAASSPPAPPPATSPPPVPSAAPARPAPRAPRPVLTRELYVAGHSRPHAALCHALGAHTQLLVLVTSAPAHTQARAAIRLTWGHFAARSDVAVAFVLGLPPPALEPAIDAEDKLYGDLIVGNFVDSYSNLTLKTLSMLEWVDTYCPRVPKFLKTDDDMFINIPRLLAYASAPNRINATNTIWGKVLKKSLPKRTPKSKYYLSPLQYPGKVLPDFATGPAYLVTTDCAGRLLRAAGEARYVRLEDVFVTGTLAQSLRVARVHEPAFYNKRVPPRACAVQRGLAIHMVRYHEQFHLWALLLDGRNKCPS